VVLVRATRDDLAQAWFERRTTRTADWPLARLLAGKQEAGARISVVIPARDEQASVGAVVTGVRRALMERAQLVDELVVIDSLSTDRTAAVARSHGATVYSVADIRPELGVRRGKGEALWKSQFVTTGDVLVFIDADLTEWGPHFVSSLVGPLLAEPEVLLVKGFYDRMLDVAPGTRSTEGGRVTELVARPLLAARWPQLSRVVQPLAGEWAIRRELFAQLPVPVGYGVEMSTLLDTLARCGIDAIAQVDLGARGHRHQGIHDLAAMALEILCVADARWKAAGPQRESAVLAQFAREPDWTWTVREVPTAERPAAATVAADG
jgi:glucosyl-3-phosphoglycerate synthase